MKEKLFKPKYHSITYKAIDYDGNQYTVDDLCDLLNSLSEENEELRQIIKDIVCATDETYTKNTSMFKVTVVFDGKMYNQIRSCLYE